jgi:hypothetical protein
MEKEIRNDAGEIKQGKYFGERMRRKRGNEARKRREEKGKRNWGKTEERREEGRYGKGLKKEAETDIEKDKRSR